MREEEMMSEISSNDYTQIEREHMGRTVFTYDVSSIPSGLDLDRIMQIYQTMGCILYDSRGGEGERPVVSIVPIRTSLIRKRDDR